ncbi:MAG: hypothetical protein IT258_22125 [Saprospiraceae bacterium]|nr:hypothetical protein [Saprospiraceae bacterium]
MEKRSFFTSRHVNTLGIGIVMLFYMVLVGCQKEEAISKDEITVTPSPLLAKGEDGPDKHEERCNCEFQIVLAGHEAPPVGFNDVAYQCFSMENCVANAACAPLDFFEICDIGFLDPCAYPVPYGTGYPTPWYPFSCQPQKSTTLTPVIPAAWFVNYSTLANGCIAVDYNNPPDAGWTLIKVRCKDACVGTGWINSEPIYVNYYDNHPLQHFALEGCGCSPVRKTTG